MKGSDFLWLAMDAFGGLGLEVVYAFWLEPAVYGVPMEEFTPGQYHAINVVPTVTLDNA